MNPRGFDHVVRTVTSSTLALGIVGAVIYQFITKGVASAELLGWAGLIVGTYIGVNATITGNGTAKRSTDPTPPPPVVPAPPPASGP